MTQSAQTRATKTRSRITLLLLFLVCVAPVAGGWLYYHFGSGLSQKNNGDLYQPARPFFSEVDIEILSSNSAIPGFKGKWTLLYMASGACETTCLEQLDTINRVRLTQGKNIKRVSILFLTDRELSQLPTDVIKESYPGLIAAYESADKAGILRLLAKMPGDDSAADGRIYIVDPNGNLVLSYDTGTEAGSIRKDLARLLRVSRVG